MRLIICLQLLLISQISFAYRGESCPTDLGSAVINIGFNYVKSEASDLAGVNADLQVMRGLYPNLKNKSEITDSNFGSKSAFIEKLRSATKEKSSVFFNYAGHGTILPDGGFAIVLPSIPEDCLQAASPNKNSAREIQVKSSLTDSDRGLARARNISQRCMSFLVTGKELAEVFKGKRVAGLIDSCFSGSITNEPGINAITSSTSLSVSPDHPSGGHLFSSVRQMMNEFSCTVSEPLSQELYLGDVVKRFRPVHLVSKGNFQVVPEQNMNNPIARAYRCESEIGKSSAGSTVTRGLSREARYCTMPDVNFGNIPQLKCSELMISKIDQNKCKNPLDKKYVVGREPLVCPNSKVLSPGTPVEVIHDSNSKNEYLAVAKYCGVIKIGKDLRLIREVSSQSRIQNDGVTEQVAKAGTK